MVQHMYSVQCTHIYMNVHSVLYTLYIPRKFMCKSKEDFQLKFLIEFHFDILCKILYLDLFNTCVYGKREYHLASFLRILQQIKCQLLSQINEIVYVNVNVHLFVYIYHSRHEYGCWCCTL